MSDDVSDIDIFGSVYIDFFEPGFYGFDLELIEDLGLKVPLGALITID